MQQAILKRINSLLQYLENHDISLTTRRLMDLCDDFAALHPFLPQATKIRADYNIKRGLGEGEIKGVELDAFKSQLTELIRKISEVELTEPEVETSEHPIQLSAQDVRKNFVNRGHVFELGPISFDLKLGEITGIVGENGNGKTTLLRILAQDLAKDFGMLNYHDLNHLQFNPFILKQHLGFIPQRLEKWNGTLLENLKYSTAIHGYPADKINQRVDFVIHRLGLTRFQNLTWKQLSSGYKLRFELAKTWVWNPKIMVLDEPIANLDLYAQQLFLQDLTHMAESTRMYAECAVRGAGSIARGISYVNELRTRANEPLIASMDLDFILAERGRELQFEGKRRTDLIRFGKFTSGDFLWEFKGGDPNGTGVSDIYKIFPISADDVVANPNLTQNPGY